MPRFLAVVFFAALGTSSAFAIYNVGDYVPNKCWTDANGKSVCLNDYSEHVRVLMFSAGWCGPCNEEFSELIPQITKYKNLPVMFFSLSTSGNSTSSQPNAAFLNSWQKKFNIPFPVLASPNDAGKDFFKNPYYIPSLAVVGATGHLKFAAVNPGVDKLFEQIDNALQSIE